MKTILLALAVIAACFITLEAAAGWCGSANCCQPEPEPIIQIT